MLFKSGLVTQISGSIGGMTGSHNRGGMYLRSRTIPTDPATTYQTVLRAYMAQLAALWTGTLTVAQRAAWDVYASNVTLPNPLGDEIHLTGLNHYIRSNLPRLQASVARVDAAPTTFDLGDFAPPTGITGDATANEVDVAFVDTDDWVDEDGAHMLVFSSREQNMSKMYFKGPYRYAGKIAGDSVTPPTTPAAITSPFALTADNAVFSMVRVSRADGRLSAPFRTKGACA